MSKLEAYYDQVCICCGRKFPAWYTYDTETKSADITLSSLNACECEAEYSPVGSAPSLSEWVEKVKGLKPFVVNYTVTYRNACLVYARDEKSAEEDALNLYGEGYFDPEENGYDGCEVEVSPASPADVGNMKYYTFLWDGEKRSNA